VLTCSHRLTATFVALPETWAVCLTRSSLATQAGRIRPNCRRHGGGTGGLGVPSAVVSKAAGFSFVGFAAIFNSPAWAQSVPSFMLSVLIGSAGLAYGPVAAVGPGIGRGGDSGPDDVEESIDCRGG
jgi:hypothetical protein